MSNNKQKLLTKANVKIGKSEKLNIVTYGLHLSPHTANSKGINVCPFATAECIASCLNTAGHGKFTQTQKARIKKTDRFLEDKLLFVQDLKKELHALDRKRIREDLSIAIRLNLTSDIAWESLRIDGMNLMELFPQFTFYDYSKIYQRLNRNKPDNYHLTFSYSGYNEEQCKELLERGFNVSIVFNTSKQEDLPKSWWNDYIVINGDETDVRYLDYKQKPEGYTKGLIVGLTYKKPKNKVDLTDNKFVVNIN